MPSWLFSLNAVSGGESATTLAWYAISLSSHTCHSLRCTSSSSSNIVTNFVLYDRFICLTPQNFTKGLIYGKIILHSSFSMVKGFWNWVLYQWRPQGCRYIGLDGLKPRHVHNFLTKQHFKLKFWILAILMAIRFHVTILTKFDQIFDQILAKLGQILVKIFKNQKVTYLGSKNA